MRLILFPLLVLALALPLRAQEASPRFGWFGTLAGSCWVGTFADGKTRHRQCYTRQYGHFLRGSAELAGLQDGQFKTSFEGDSVFAWNEAAKAIDYFIWGADGSYRQLQATYEGELLHFPIPSRADPAQVAYRSTWRRLNDDSFEVSRQRPAGESWSTELTVVYRREVPDKR